jgi:hypothetical protein
LNGKEGWWRKVKGEFCNGGGSVGNHDDDGDGGVSVGANMPTSERGKSES